MVTTRRHERARPKALNGKRLAASKNGSGTSFVPSGYEEAKALVERVAPLDIEGLKTFFLTGDKRGIDVYEPIAVNGKHFRNGFRGVFVSASEPAFDNHSARLVGVVEGDDYEAGLEWAKSNVLDELHADYLRSGGGTADERRRALKAFTDAKAAVEKQQEKLAALEAELHRASVGLVRRFGKSPLELEGRMWDPSYAREKVYWKQRRRG